MIAETFLAAGANVHICDINSDKVAKFVATREGVTGRVVDIANADAVATMFDDLKPHHGRLDVLVNNAGIAGPTGAVEELDTAAWDHTIAVNINGQFYCTKHAVPLLTICPHRDPGQIICTHMINISGPVLKLN